MRCSAFSFLLVVTIIVSLTVGNQVSAVGSSLDGSIRTPEAKSNEERESLSPEGAGAVLDASEIGCAKNNEDISTWQNKQKSRVAAPLRNLSLRNIVPLDIKVNGKVDHKTGAEYPAVTPDKIIEILSHIPNMQDHFFEDGQFTGDVQPLSKEEYGVSTDFLYLVSVRDDKRAGTHDASMDNKSLAIPKAHKPMFIVKGVSKSNAQEMNNLERINFQEILNNIPLNIDFPVLTRPEVLYSYTLVGNNPDEKETRYVSVLHLAKGKSLKKVIQDVFSKNTLNEGQKIERLRSIFYQLGASLASFNQHCAGVGPGSSIKELNDRLPFVHEDLHFANIFVYEKPNQMNTADVLHYKARKGHSTAEINSNLPTQKIHLSRPYRIYLIDNETLGRASTMSWYIPQWKRTISADGQIIWIKTQPLKPRYVAGQLQMLYGWSLFGQNNSNFLNDHAIYKLYYEGLIKGYASKFSLKHRAGVIEYLANELEMINSMLLTGKYRSNRTILTRLEKTLFNVLSGKIAKKATKLQIQGVQKLLEAAKAHLENEKEHEDAQRAGSTLPVGESHFREMTPPQDADFFNQAEDLKVARKLEL